MHGILDTKGFWVFRTVKGLQFVLPLALGSAHRTAKIHEVPKRPLSQLEKDQRRVERMLLSGVVSGAAAFVISPFRWDAAGGWEISIPFAATTIFFLGLLLSFRKFSADRTVIAERKRWIKSEPGI